MKIFLSLFGFSLLVTIIVSVGGCKKNDTPATQTVTYSLADYQGQTQYYNYQYTDTFIDSITAAGIQQAFITQGITYNLSKVTSAKLNSLTLTAQNGANLNNVSSVQVYLNSAGSAGLGTEIAYSASIPSNVSTVTLSMTGNELKGYLATNNVITIWVKNTGSENGTNLDFGQGVILAQVQQ